MKPFDPLNPPHSFSGLKPTGREIAWLVEMTTDPAADPKACAKRVQYKGAWAAGKRLMATYGEALRQAAAAEDGLAPVADVDERRRVLTSILRDGTNPEKLRAAQLLGMIEGDYAPELAKKRGRREMEDAFEALVSKAPGLKRKAGLRARSEPERGLEVPESSDNGSEQDSEALDPEGLGPESV